MVMNFQNLYLGPEQQELLGVLVEAYRNTPRENRQQFDYIQSHGGSSLSHPGLGSSLENVYEGDISALGSAGLLSITPRNHLVRFDITPKGFRYYEYMKEQSGQPTKRVEDTMNQHLASDRFQRAYPAAYQKWAEAERLLWGSDSEQRLTSIGHFCREAMQEFATALVDRYQPPNVKTDKASIIARMRAVLDLREVQLGTTAKPFLEALLTYWGTVSDLVNRQEHGGQREAAALVWDDARRVVFQTAVVMFEIDQSLSRS